MIATYKKNIQLNYINLRNSDSIIEGYQYSMPSDRAFESFLSQQDVLVFRIYHTDNES